MPSSCITRSNFILKESRPAAEIRPSPSPLSHHLFVLPSSSPSTFLWLLSPFFFVFASHFSRMIQIRPSSARRAAFPPSRDVAAFLLLYGRTSSRKLFLAAFFFPLHGSPVPSSSSFPSLSYTSMCGTSRLIILIFASTSFPRRWNFSCELV